MLAYLEDRGIEDPQVMAAMTRVPRHAFVPEAVRSKAYGRRPLPIGQGQTISTPFIVASMTALLELQGTERVLEIGTGCGYQTAVLCEMVPEVYSIEIVAEVAEFGARNLARLGYSANLRVGDGADGWPDRAPFDRILLAATAPTIPRRLLKQLAVGGIALGPEEVPPREGDDPHDRQEVLARYQRLEQGFERTEIYGVRFVPMTGKVQQ
jgi:protein-L-isoaspartate(D-aspartate) O-methyltransferase